jgi:tripeptide aminopeptidase
MIYDYRGGDIVLNNERGIVLSTDTFPELNNYIGNTLITTDGTTLLGADDKAGIAAIMYAVEYMVNNPTMPHGKVCIAFTPDEEIGMGAAHFDVEGFGAKYAYTIDGGEVGEIEYENFNAASASISIEGKNIHPGYAKDKMVNALLVAMDINAMLPSSQRPENTEGYEGFFHLTAMDGTVEQASMDYIIRDHSKEKFEEKKQLMTDVVLAVNEKYGTNVAKLELKDSYYNMKEKVMPHYHIVEKAVEAMELAGVEPKIKPIRGGTDGATLSFKGLPCPNIFAGGHNFHGKYEYIPVESMQKAAQVILNIISIYAKVGKE